MKLAWILVLALAVSSCGNSVDCDGWCNLTVQCAPTILVGPGCTWVDGDGTARNECMSACDQTAEQLSDAKRDATREAVDCFLNEIGGTCDANAVSAAAQKCDRSGDVGDFADAFDELYAIPDVECTE